MKFYLIAVILLAFGLAGCGGTDHVVPNQTNYLGNNFYLSKVFYKNGILNCVILNDGKGGHGQWGGPSCDFEQFHKTYGYEGGDK